MVVKSQPEAHTVSVAGRGVGVGGMGVGVGGMGVGVGVGVSVGGMGVLVGVAVFAGVSVGGREVAVGGIGVAVGSVVDNEVVHPVRIIRATIINGCKRLNFIFKSLHYLGYYAVYDAGIIANLWRNGNPLYDAHSQ